MNNKEIAETSATLTAQSLWECFEEFSKNQTEMPQPLPVIFPEFFWRARLDYFNFTEKQITEAVNSDDGFIGYWTGKKCFVTKLLKVI